VPGQTQAAATEFSALAVVALAYIGLRVDLTVLAQAPLFLFLLISVVFFGKVIGTGLPARIVGLSDRDAAAVGVGMSARGAGSQAQLPEILGSRRFLADTRLKAPVGRGP